MLGCRLPRVVRSRCSSRLRPLNPRRLGVTMFSKDHPEILPAPARGRLALGLALAISVSLASVPTWAQSPTSRRSLAIPQFDWGWEMLEVREWAQLQSVDRFKVFYDFQFTDELSASGIRFVNQITPDSAKYYQPNHYDHGNGIVVADVDGDQRYDIYFMTQLGRNELWRNLGDGRFEDITDRAGVALADRVGASAAFGDVDNDGDPDLYVTTVKMGNALFLNDGKGVFTDVTSEAGLDYTGHSSGAMFFDYDGDGLLDLYLTNVGIYTTNRKASDGSYWIGIGIGTTGRSAFKGHLVPERTEYSILYKNLGDHRFEDVSAKVNLRDGGWSGDVGFSDINGDSRPDVYVLNMQGDDHFYINVEGERFVEETEKYFPHTPWGAMGIKFFDYDNNGRMDLILTDMHSDMTRKVTPGYEKLKSLVTSTDTDLQGGENNLYGNAFWENLGDGRWQERSDELGIENYWPWGLSVGDLNADGWEDVFISSGMNFPFEYGVNSLLLNNQGKIFLDSEFIVGIEPRAGGTAKPWYDPDRPWLSTRRPWFELDCSGADRSHTICQGRSGSFTVMGNEGSRSSVIFDLDEDGDLDIVTNEYNDPPQVLISNLSDKRQINFIKVELVGKGSNRDGLGAVVEVGAGLRTLTQQNDGKSGYLSQSSLPLYFGLGDAEKINSIKVRWPSGRQQVVTRGITLNSTIEIVEPGAQD